MVSKISRKTLFTKIERYLLYNQANPFVVSNKYSHKLEDDMKVMEQIELPTPQDQAKIYRKLATGIFADKRLAKLVTKKEER